ncbi:MAG: class I SAM-dependent methyltransferase [Terracidiphilus sp.]|jgi:methyltransferase-like protein
MRREHDPYDSFAYPGFSFPDTHPDRLATMAILHGLDPTQVEHCRVLEIGCNEGANLIPVAYAMPDSELVGLDLARLPVERAQDRIRELGLKNIRIFQGNLLNVGAELGRFDYIIAHGFYAWVPEPVRDRLLALCGELLTANGVAFVSYNALPGSHLRTMMREMMLYSAEGIDDPERRVSEGVAFLQLLAEMRDEGDPIRLLFEERLKKLTTREPGATFHDELSEAYYPVQFSEFVAHARKHGLQYLCEAAWPPPTDPCYRSDLRPALEKVAGDDFLRREQMLDFVRMRMYRETLLCRAECAVRRDYPPEYLRRLLLASPARSTAGATPGAKVFTLPSGMKMESNRAGIIALLESLETSWPRALSLAEMEPKLAEAGFLLDGERATLLMRLAVAKMIEFHAWSAPVAEEIASRPKASACSRQEARTRAHVATLLHGTFGFDDPLIRSFLQLLDGTRDRKALLKAMHAEFPAVPEKELEDGIELGLRHFHRAGLLEV